MEFLKGIQAAQGGSRRKCLLKPAVLNGFAVLIFKCMVAAGCDVARSVPQETRWASPAPHSTDLRISEKYKGKAKIPSSAAPGSFVVSGCKESGFPHESFSVEQA